MLKKYSILIHPKNGVKLADNVQLSFRCNVSSPSEWIESGLTSEKGLTFLNNEGQQLNSGIFKNQAYFNNSEVAQTESEAISQYIYLMLFEHYWFMKTDIDVMVSADD